MVVKLLKRQVCEALITCAVSRFETWGKKILTAVEEQGRLLSSLTDGGRNGLPPSTDHMQLLRQLDMDGDNLETLSRKDTPWTPITGSDMILNWSVFPQEKPVGTFPSSEYTEKAKPSHLGRCNAHNMKKNSLSHRRINMYEKEIVLTREKKRQIRLQNACLSCETFT